MERAPGGAGLCTGIKEAIDNGGGLMKMRWAGLAGFLALALAASAQVPAARLELIPPSPVTDKIVLDIRGAVENHSSQPRVYSVSLFVDGQAAGNRVAFRKLRIPAHASAGVDFRRSTAGWAGRHRMVLVADAPGQSARTEREVQVLPSALRSTQTIDGAWVGIVHWSEAEGRYWNAEIRTLSENDWRQQIRGMHGIGMDTVIVQEVFRNQAYYGANKIASTGYRGLAYYPSALFPGRVAMASRDPLEAILCEADRLHMHVFLGVGMYAWFDFSPASLEWHKKVAAELWRRYGHHPSFYGWYVSEEAYGSLIPDQGEAAAAQYRREILHFFTAFQAFCRGLAPEKPVLFAPNTMGLLQSKEVWPKLLEHIDIVCPFGFQRMPPGDLTGAQAAALWQEMADQAGAHLWMDMEAFTFADQALVPRPIGDLIRDLRQYPNFEKILCYQYSGIFNSPESAKQPGGLATVRLYRDYRQYLLSRRTGN